MIRIVIIAAALAMLAKVELVAHHQGEHGGVEAQATSEQQQ